MYLFEVNVPAENNNRKYNGFNGYNGFCIVLMETMIVSVM